jgi:hypothetical protein
VVLRRSLGLAECSDSITPGNGYGTLVVNTSGDLWYVVNHAGVTKSKLLAQFSAM